MTRSSDKTPRRPAGGAGSTSGGSRGGERPPMRARPDGKPPRRDRPEGGGKFDGPRRPGKPGFASKPRASASVTRTSTMPGERIAKAMARAGLCSRRDAEAWIAEGRVAINGRVIDSPAINVVPEDKVTVDGKPLAARERTRLFLFHKPRGTVTTDRDPEGRKTIFEVLPPDLPRLITIGRLDINTEGLLLLTNDGGLARVLELPSTGWVRRYRVRAHGQIDQPTLDRLSRGITVDGIAYAGIEATLDRQQGDNVWLTMGLREGKNREIKRVLEHLGLSVNRLIRLSFGPFQLGELAERAVEEVRPRILKDQLGLKLAQEAGVDFDSPLLDRTGAPAEAPRRAPRARPAEEEREIIREKPRAPGPRKHVTALRAIVEDADETGERRRREKGETQDRRGRTVAVERKVKAAPPPEPRRTRSEAWRDKGRSEDGLVAGRGPAGGRGRPARPGDARSFDKRPPRDGTEERGGWQERRPRALAVDERAGDRSPWEKRERPRFDAPRGERPSVDGRPPRAREDTERARPRSFGDGPRPERRDGERPRGRPPGEGAERGRSFGDRPRSGKPGSKPFGERPSGGKPSGGRPGGKPFGGKPGGRPSGGKPGGSRPPRNRD